MVSEFDHCLWEVLLRRNTGDIDCDVCVVISDQPELKHVADTFQVPFEVYSSTEMTKSEQESAALHALKEEHDVDLVILARYLHGVSAEFCNTFQNKVINIHHSFLPAFVGKCPVNSGENCI